MIPRDLNKGWIRNNNNNYTTQTWTKLQLRHAKTSTFYYLQVSDKVRVHMWSDLLLCLKENISCVYLKFVPEGLKPNEGLFLSSPGYTLHIVVITASSAKIWAAWQYQAAQRIIIKERGEKKAQDMERPWLW